MGSVDCLVRGFWSAGRILGICPIFRNSPPNEILLHHCSRICFDVDVWKMDLSVRGTNRGPILRRRVRDVTLKAALNLVTGPRLVNALQAVETSPCTGSILMAADVSLLSHLERWISYIEFNCGRTGSFDKSVKRLFMTKVRNESDVYSGSSVLEHRL
jgi:hypothetical protein